MLLFPTIWVNLLAWGYHQQPEWIQRTAFYARTSIWFLPLISFTSLTAGWLYARRHFFLPAVSPSLVNLSMLAVLGYAFWRHPSMEQLLFLLVLSLIAGGLLQLLIHLFSLLRLPPPSPSPSTGTDPSGEKDFRAFRKLLIPVVFSTGFNRLTLFLSSSVASMLQPGLISVLYFAYRIFHLPQGLLSVGIATVSLPDISEHTGSGEARTLVQTLTHASLLSLLVLWPTTLLMMHYALPLVRLFYFRGAFSERALHQTALVLLLYLPAVPLLGLSRILLNAYFSRKEIRTPILAWGAATVIQAASILYALRAGFFWIPLATSLGVFTQLIFLWSRFPVSLIEASPVNILRILGIPAAGILAWRLLVPLPEDTWTLLLQLSFWGLAGVLWLRRGKRWLTPNPVSDGER